jgi:GTPase Era involved in 16S rRNA processing
VIKTIKQPPNPMLLKVAVIGMPNAGKSTLINRLVGSAVSAVSPKVQTTRERILAILTEDETQVVFFDTPGIVPYREGRRLRLARPLITEARHSVWEADLVITLVVRCPVRYRHPGVIKDANQLLHTPARLETQHTCNPIMHDSLNVILTRNFFLYDVVSLNAGPEQVQG